MSECNTSTIIGLGGLVHKWRNITKWERALPRQCLYRTFYFYYLLGFIYTNIYNNRTNMQL